MPQKEDAQKVINTMLSAIDAIRNNDAAAYELLNDLKKYVGLEYRETNEKNSENVLLTDMSVVVKRAYIYKYDMQTHVDGYYARIDRAVVKPRFSYRDIIFIDWTESNEVSLAEIDAYFNDVRNSGIEGFVYRIVDRYSHVNELTHFITAQGYHMDVLPDVSIKELFKRYNNLFKAFLKLTHAPNL